MKHIAPRRRRLFGAAATLATSAALVAGALLATTPAAAAPGDSPAPAAVAPGDAQWLTGYWHNFDNGSVTMTVKEIPKAYNLVAIAFAENLPGVPGGVMFNVASAELKGYTNAQFKADVAAVRAEGRKVVLSVGGEKGNVIVSNATQAKNFADTVYATMQEFGFDGVDIDLEHGINAEFMTSALRQLSAKVGPSLVLTMAPQTIDYQATSMGYYQLTLNVKDILTVTNTQYYNSGAMLGADGKVYSQGSVDFLTALSVVKLEMGLRPDQVGIGVPAVPKAAGGGYQPIANVVKAVDCLEKGTNCGTFKPAKQYGKIGGVMTWSVNWDKTNNYELANVVGARLGSGTGTPPDPTDPTDPGTNPTDPGTNPTDPGTNPTDPGTNPTDPGATDPGTVPCAAAAWSSTAVYTGGAKVGHQGKEYTAKWWTQGDTPGTNAVWNLVGNCDGGTNPTDPGTNPTDPGTNPTDPATGTCAAAWGAGSVYTAGTLASYQGKDYKARWWTQGEAPGSATWGAWQLVGACS